MEVEHLSTMWGPIGQIPRIPNKNNQKVNLKCISEQVLGINKQPSGKLKKINGTDTVGTWLFRITFGSEISLLIF